VYARSNSRHECCWHDSAQCGAALLLRRISACLLEAAHALGALGAGASDDIRRATDLAYRAVSEFGLNPAIGPINVNVLSAGGSEESLFGKDGGEISRCVFGGGAGS
jgi:hypothetical protein